VEEIGAEEQPAALLEQNTGVPAVRQVRCRNEAEAVAAGLDHLVSGQTTRRAAGEVLDVDERPDLAAGCLRARRNREPVVEGAAFIDLEVTPADPAE